MEELVSIPLVTVFITERGNSAIRKCYTIVEG